MSGGDSAAPTAPLLGVVSPLDHPNRSAAVNGTIPPQGERRYSGGSFTTVSQNS